MIVLPGMRPTNDADTVVDVRADPTMLATFTGTLTDLGFRSAGISAEGLQHRWVRGDASLDEALQRSETVRVSVAGRDDAQNSLVRLVMAGEL